MKYHNLHSTSSSRTSVSKVQIFSGKLLYVYILSVMSILEKVVFVFEGGFVSWMLIMSFVK